MRIVCIVFIAAVAAVPPAEAKHKRYNPRPATIATGQVDSTKAAIDQPRDPADKAMDKKIKSICRGC